MTLPGPKTYSEDVVRALRLSAGEFDWERGDDEAVVGARVAGAIEDARARTLQIVGAGNYSSTDEVTAAAIALAERKLACAVMLRQRLIVLCSRPEEAPPPELVDLGALRGEIEALQREWAELLGPYATEDGGQAGTAFSWGASGVDETPDDYHRGDYRETDHGLL